MIALPEQLFYNTGIATYVWVVTNRKAPVRKGKVQLVDATSFWVPMRRSLGDKRRETLLDRALDILKILADFKDGDTRMLAKDAKQEELVVSRIFPTTFLGSRKITVERPLRLNFQASQERIARLEDERGFQALALSKKKGAAAAKEQAEGRARQEELRKLVLGLPDTLFNDRDEFERVLERAATKADVQPSAAARKAILSALSERVDTFFDREVRPHVPDAWIDTGRRDSKDGKVGFVGYEINFNRYFYRYTPPRPLEAIEADIRGIETDIMRMLAEVTGRPTSP